MTTDDQHLRDKARLLLQRERELFELRQKHEQMGVWLGIGQALPELFVTRQGSLAHAWDGLRKLMVGKLRLQRVLLFEIEPAELRALAPAGAARPLPAAARALLERQLAGLCNEPATEAAAGLAQLAEVLGLHRFIWSRVDRAELAPILIAAGFDRTKAVFQSPFVDEDVAHFGNAAQQVQSLLSNALLIAELEREKNQLREANESLGQRDAELQRAAERLRLANESLEQRVQQRTQELAGKNRELRLVLDTVDQALLTVDLAGRLAPERSSVADRWFGGYTGSPKFVEHVGAEPRYRALFELGLDALRDGLLPVELCLSQMPKRLVRAERTFDCRYLPIEEDGRLRGLLLAIDDVTERLLRAREDAEQRELLAAFAALTRDRHHFLTFCGEAERVVAQLADDGLAHDVRKRLLHTLKGNAATLGLQLLSELCHQAESQLAKDPTSLATSQQLVERWRVIVKTLRTVAPAELEHTIEVSPRMLDALAQRARSGASAEQLLEELRRLGWESSDRWLGRLAQYAREVAARLGKASLEVQIETDAARLEPELWAPVWSALVHVVRNAVDHGIEPAEQRAAQGKSPLGLLRLSGRRSAGGYRLEVEDDGRGIDWEVVRRCCEQRGLPSATRDDLVSAILSANFSTRAQISETSGRGIGLAVLASTVREKHAELAVESEPGRGTRWILTFPGEGTAAAFTSRWPERE